MTALPTKPVLVVDDDPARKRVVEEVEMTLPDGATFRIGIITVADDAPSNMCLGNHHHPGEETFHIVEGEALLYILDADDVPANPADIDRSKISVQTVVKGDTLVIPAGTVHTFVPTPGTVLRSYARMPFDKDTWIVGCKLPIIPGL